MSKIVLSAVRANLSSSFPIWILLISLSCLIALARTSSMLNKCDKSKKSFLLFQTLEKMLFTFLGSVWCCLWVWSTLCHYTEVCSLCTYFIDHFIMKGCGMQWANEWTTCHSEFYTLYSFSSWASFAHSLSIQLNPYIFQAVYVAGWVSDTGKLLKNKG